jgi:tetratricopeptide (TPR) repeat protein
LEFFAADVLEFQFQSTITAWLHAGMYVHDLAVPKSENDARLSHAGAQNISSRISSRRALNGIVCFTSRPREKMQLEIDVTHTRRRKMTASLVLAVASCCMPAKPQTNADQTALLLEQEGKTAEAEEAWKASAKAHPENPVPYAHIGLIEARQEHYSQAIAFYRKAMALNPAMPGLRLNLGLALFKDGQYKQAIEMFTPLLKASAPNADETQRLTVLMGMSHYGLGQYAAAVPFLKNASGRDAQNLPLLLALAHSCLLSQQYPCVLDAFHRMVALNADSAEADMLVGEALDEMKDRIGATREFRAAVQANPKEPNVHFGLGYLLWIQGQTQEAAQQFQDELENDPEHLQAMLYLADSWIQLNRMDDARPLLEKLVKLNPASAKGHLDLGIVYAEAGRAPDALREFKTAVALKPDDVNAHYRLGRLYRSMGKTAMAKAEFDKSKTLNKTADDALLKAMSKVPHPESTPQKALDSTADK